MLDFFYSTLMYYFHYLLMVVLILGEVLAIVQVFTMIPEKRLLWQEKTGWIFFVLVFNFLGVILYHIYLKVLKKPYLV